MNVRGWGLAIAAAGFWAGIVVAGLVADGAGGAAGVVVLALGLAALVRLALRRSPPAALGGVVAIAWLIVSFGLLGVGWELVRDAHVEASPLARLAGRTVRVFATVQTDPEEQSLGWHATVGVDVLVPQQPGWPRAVSVHDPLWIEGRGPVPKLDAGERIAATGTLEALRDDFGRYLRHRGYPATFYADTVTPRGPPTNPLLRAADALRAALRRSLASVFPRRDAGLMMGLTLGDTSQLDPGIEDDFRATGLSHLTAVSGENLAMFLAPILALGMAIRLGRRARFALGLGAVAFFVMLTRAEPSVLRAAAMAGLTLLGVFLGRPRSVPAIMGGAVLVLLAINPTLVYAIGFQLSVGATAGMAMLATPLADRLRFIPRPIALAASTTIGAQAGVTPLLLYYFGVVPTVTLPANVLAFPAVGPGMLLGLAAAAVGLVSRPIGLFAAFLARIPLGYLEGLARRLAHSPLPSMTSPGGQVWLLGGGLVAVCLAAWWLRSGRHLPRRAAVIALGTVVPLFIWSGAIRAGPPSHLTVTFFDVGQGDAALVRSPGGAAILIDGGPDPDLVATKLAALGVRRLDLMVATHPHADHVGGLPAVLVRFPVGLIIDPGCHGDSPYYAAFLAAVRAAHAPFRHPRPGAVLRVGDVRIDVLGPEHCFIGTNSDPNNDSLILRVSEGDASIMFPGDSEEPGETDVLRDEPGLLPAVLLKVPHHGGATTLPEFFAAVHARVAVVSVGPNRYGHPVPSVLATMVRDGMRVYRTDHCGDVTVTLNGAALTVTTARAAA